MKKAYILCSGAGKKIWPYNDKWQKSCLPIGSIPNILHLVDNITAAGIEEIIVVASYKAQQLKYYLREKPHVVIVEENCPNGTGKSLLHAWQQQPSDEFLVVYGDSVVDAESISNAVQDKTEIAVLVQEIQGELNKRDWLCADVHEGMLSTIMGHPRGSYCNHRVAGVFVLNKSVLPYIEANPGRLLNVPVGGMPPEECMLEQSLEMMLEDGISIKALPVKKYYVDLDKPWNLLEANELFIKEKMAQMPSREIAADACIDNSAVIMGKIRLGKGSRIGKNVIIKGDVWVGDDTTIDCGAILEGTSIIGNGTIITDNCKISSYTTIGNSNKIGFGAEIKGITFDKVCMVHTSEVYGIIGACTDIAAGCMTGILRFDDAICTQKVNGRVEPGCNYSNAVFIGDYTRTGISNIFYPSVKVGSNSALGPGLIIDKDIPSSTLVLAEQNKIYKEWGSHKYGW